MLFFFCSHAQLHNWVPYLPGLTAAKKMDSCSRNQLTQSLVFFFFAIGKKGIRYLTRMALKIPLMSMGLPVLFDVIEP